MCFRRSAIKVFVLFASILFLTELGECFESRAFFVVDLKAAVISFPGTLYFLFNSFAFLPRHSTPATVATEAGHYKKY